MRDFTSTRKPKTITTPTGETGVFWPYAAAQDGPGRLRVPLILGHGPLLSAWRERGSKRRRP